MAYGVDWVAKVVTIPLSDLTLISGVNYSLDTDAVHDELRRLEWEFADGLWAPAIIDYGLTKTLSGIDYSPTVEMINGYTWDVSSSNINISLIGPNSNLLDTYIPGNGISVLANNSGGKIISGSGVTAQDKIDIGEQVWDTPLRQVSGTFGEWVQDKLLTVTKFIGLK